MRKPFPASFFAANRQKLYGQLPPSSFVALTANAQMQRNADLAHPFRQEPYFWYLTGIADADWLFLADIDSGEEWLISPDIPEVMRLFSGGLSSQAAVAASGVAQVLDAKAGRATLKQLLASKKQAQALKPTPRKLYGVVTNPAQQDLWRKLKVVDRQDVRLLVARQRAIKQPVELEALQQAIDITVEASVALLKEVRNLKHEQQVAAYFDYQCYSHGVAVAFDSVVAVGTNACTVHHQADTTPLGTNDWLLFDVGAEVNRYCADLARTVPLGDISDRHLAVYEALMRVHDHAASLLTPGQNVRTFLEETEEIMMHEYVKLGILKHGDKQAYRRYFPQMIGHGLGIDTHDTLGRPETFAENMVMTVEPGVYIPQEGIGMRIESVAHIQAGGATLMTSRLPTGLDELQKLIGA